MLIEKTRVFILENEKPDINNLDVSPYRCAYCGELAIIERETLPESTGMAPMAQSVYCECEDAMTETNLRKEINQLHGTLASKSLLLSQHMDTKVFDSDTHMMRYEDAVASLKKQFGITE